jgi:hypothetical protein
LPAGVGRVATLAKNHKPRPRRQIDMSPYQSEKPRINYFFGAVFAKVHGRIHQLIENEHDRRFYTALVTGGKVSASSVVSLCEGVKKVWDDSDKKGALALTKLFTLLMLSQCYRWLNEKEPRLKEKRRTARQAAASDVLRLFGDDSKDALKDFLNLDIQFNYEMDHKPHMLHLGSLLLAKACEACQHKCIEWSKVSFPVKEIIHLMHSGAIIDSAPLRNLDDNKALWHSHAKGIQAMAKCHEEQIQFDNPATGTD